MKDFRNRLRQLEQMDDPQVPVTLMKQVFKDLERTNILLGGHHITLGAIDRLLLAKGIQDPVIIDAGCGDGLLIRLIADHFRLKGLRSQLIGIDQNISAVSLARAYCKAYPEISVIRADLLSFDLKEYKPQIVVCSLTLHHFSDRQIPGLLDNWSRAASLGIIINDLHRNPLPYYLFQLFSAIFIKTKIAKEDGLISIRSGFRKKELLRFAALMPNFAHSIKWRWVFRYLWTIEPQSHE